MATKQQTDTLMEWDAREIARKGVLTSELELERAVWAERSLNLLSEEQPNLEVLRKEIFNMIVQYESLHWSDSDTITKNQIAESDRAERQVKKEFSFFRKRKESILSKLKKYGLNQNDLAVILAHRKSYVSELLNGIRAFSMNDIIIMHKLFDIQLEDLVFTEIPVETEKRIKEALEKTVSNSSKTKKPAQVTSLVKALYS
ncbi:helix-turn-helix domain-containing protein [Dyadobacter sp. LJ53]|uniref:helix-turn-helix domain-containing protein n=1 Tax=Dyadobacter chenwenxiniae TaxID=2906456 RepID=UPI001F28923C|nr:helix-turn-helix domain-containing protein [Dyadobacter chenwenxiniae]MCF0053827.1 helix-turn-helix domain-containing protein [Dyadobacter chenwenxiniae]